MQLSAMGSPPDKATAAITQPAGLLRKPPGLGTHYLRYSVSNALVLLAGFISFPILTRMLDNTEFGILRYYETFMLVGVALAKLGSQHAIVRLYPYGDPGRMRTFGTNVVLLPLVMSATLCAVAIVGMLLWSGWSGRSFSPVLWCVVAITPMLAASAIVQSVMRAGERSDVVMVTRIIGRMLELVLVLGAVILVQQSALAVYGGKLVATVLLLAWLMHWLRRNVRFAREAIDTEAFRGALVYGLPLMGHELAYAIFSNVDRVMLRAITDDFAVVGIYTIGMALALQVNLFIDTTLSEAFVPVANRAYETGGNKAVRALKKQVLVPMTYAVVAIIAMVLVTGEDLIVALSGPSKAASGEVFVVLGIAVAAHSLLCISNFGMLLKRRTMPVLMITVGTAAVSVVMNFILIPRMGYMGAAWSVAISYAAMSTARFIWCPKGLVQLPAARTLAVAIALGTLLVSVAQGADLFGVQGAWARLAVAGALFVPLYALPVLVLDPDLRQAALALLARATARRRTQLPDGVGD
ncbi:MULTISPECIES: oligosaccharide flippase family protein [unclassified Luteimonas]